MKDSLLIKVKYLLGDRVMTALIITMLLFGLAYAAYVGLTLQPSDLQVATRYTSFGDTNFYRDKWYYLISFAVFGLLIIGVHAMIAAKLYLRGQRQLALFLLALSVFIIIIAGITARSVLRVAFL